MFLFVLLTNQVLQRALLDDLRKLESVLLPLDRRLACLGLVPQEEHGLAVGLYKMLADEITYST